MQLIQRLFCSHLTKKNILMLSGQINPILYTSFGGFSMLVSFFKLNKKQLTKQIYH